MSSSPTKYIPNADEAYAAIELNVDGEVFAAPCPTIWLEDITVQWNDRLDKEVMIADVGYWPSDETNLNLKLFTRSKPRRDWRKLSNVRVFCFCRSLQQAKQQAEKATTSSDLSDGDDLPNKRKRKNTEFYQAPQDNDNSTDDESPQPMKRMKISGNAANNRNKQIESDDDFGDDGGSDLPLASYSTRTPRSQQLSASGTTDASQSNVRTPSSIQLGTAESTKPSSSVSQKKQTGSSVSKSPGLRTPAPGNSDPVRRDIFASPSTQSESAIARTVLAAVANFRLEITALQKIVYKIYVATCNPQETMGNEAKVPILPIDTVEKFQEFCEHCKDENQKLSMVRFIAEFASSTNFRTSIFNIMAKAFTNEMGMLYNVNGFNRAGVSPKKLRFKDTTPYNVIKSAVKFHCKMSKKSGTNTYFNLDAFDQACSAWLKDSKKRHEHQLAKQKKAEERARLLDLEAGEEGEEGELTENGIE